MPLSIDFVQEKFKKPFVIGVGGLATSGKDTFFSLLQSYLEAYGIKARRFALADELKKEIDPYLQSQFGISAFTTNPEEKRLIRPCLVSHGFVRRQTTKGAYWTGKIDSAIQESIENGIVPVVTDIRYAEFDVDELAWLSKSGGKLVHVTRYVEHAIQNGEMVKTFIAPPNEDERKNDPIIKERADFRVEWRTEKSLSTLGQYVEDFVKII